MCSFQPVHLCPSEMGHIPDALARKEWHIVWCSVSVQFPVAFALELHNPRDRDETRATPLCILGCVHEKQISTAIPLLWFWEAGVHIPLTTPLSEHFQDSASHWAVLAFMRIPAHRLKLAEPRLGQASSPSSKNPQAHEQCS